MDSIEMRAYQESRDVIVRLESQLAAAKAEIENIKKVAVCYRESALKGLEAYQEVCAENKRLREALKVANCPSCPNQGWYEHCYTVPESQFNQAQSALDGGKA